MYFNIAYQTDLRQVLTPLTPVIGNKDYDTFKNNLDRIDEIIRLGGFMEIITEDPLNKALQKEKERAEKNHFPLYRLSDKVINGICKYYSKAFRCTIARFLVEKSFRKFSCQLADSMLLQNFCQLDNFDCIKVPSKSALEQYEKLIPEEVVGQVINELLKKASDGGGIQDQILGLENPIDMSDLFMDTTCVKANIHFPVDWVLLRDATRTLMKAVRLIRTHGLINRMDPPEQFIKEMNNLCIQMANEKNKKDGKKKRKAILRSMKKLIKKIKRHAETHRDLLETNWRLTELRRGETVQILKRINNILNQLPAAVFQAHERIIGERKIPDKQKILSLYEAEIHVIVRGKAEARVEFGNSFFICEQKNGIIVDWDFFEKRSPGDPKILRDSIERLENRFPGYHLGSATTDRGFFSEENKKFLEKKKIEDFMCPLSVRELAERLKDEEFRNHQRRRSQTEGRIGILKNNFFGRPLRSKGFANRSLGVAWGILAHNLWVIARLPQASEAKVPLLKAA